MDIEALRSFIAFVETGSFTRAAQQVHRTQSAVSQQMKKLEQQTNKTLFVKQGRDQVLTEHGKFLLGYAKRIINLHDDALVQLKKGQNMRPLTLGCPDDYVQVTLPKVISIIRQIVPELPIKLCCHNSLQLRKMLDSGELDLAIATSTSGMTPNYFLQADKGVWAYSGNDAHLKNILALPKLPLILYDESCHFHHAAVENFSKQTLSYEVVTASSSASAIISLVMQGMGITVVVNDGLGCMSKLSEALVPFSLASLPTVDIELCLPANTHPNFGRIQAEAVCEFYKKTAINL